MHPLGPPFLFVATLAVLFLPRVVASLLLLHPPFPRPLLPVERTSHIFFFSPHFDPDTSFFSPGMIFSCLPPGCLLDAPAWFP